MTPRPVHRLQPAAFALALAAIALALHVLGRGPLAAPPVGSLAEASAWLTEHDPVVVGLALLRLAALGLTAHLALTSSIAAVGHLLRRPTIVLAADGWTLPPFRSALRRAAGLGLSATAVLTSPIPGAQASTLPAPPEAGTATMRAVDGTVAVLAPTSDPSSGTATIRLVPPPERHGSATIAERAPAATPPRPAPPRPAPPDADRRHVVEPGDHLWQLAADALAADLGRRPTEAEVVPYWRRVVAANPQLVDADLLHPGDEVVVPRP